MKKIRQLPAEQIKQWRRKPLSETDSKRLIKMDQDAQWLLEQNLRNINYNRITNRYTLETQKIFNKDNLFEEVFGKWINPIQKCLVGTVAEGTYQYPDNGIKRDEDMNVEIRFLVEDEFISFIPTKDIVKARLWHDSKLLFYRAYWAEDEPIRIPLKFVIQNFTEPKTTWRFKDMLRWDIVESKEQTRKDKPTKSTWLRPKPISERPKVAWAKGKLKSPEIAETIKDVIPQIGAFEKRIEKINGRYFQFYSLVCLLRDYNGIIKDLSAGVTDPRALKIISGYVAAQVKALFASFWAVVNLILSAIAIVAFILGLMNIECDKIPDAPSGPDTKSPPITEIGKSGAMETEGGEQGTKKVVVTSTSEVTIALQKENYNSPYLTEVPEPLLSGPVYKLASIGPNILVTTDGAILVSEDGKSFNPATIEKQSKFVNYLFSSDGSAAIYAFPWNSNPVVYKSDDGGINWKMVYSDSDNNFKNSYFLALKHEKYDGILFLGNNRAREFKAKWINLFTGATEEFTQYPIPKPPQIRVIDQKIYWVGVAWPGVWYCDAYPSGGCVWDDEAHERSYMDITKIGDSLIVFDPRGLYAKQKGERNFKPWKKWDDVLAPAVGSPYNTPYEAISNPDHNWQPMGIAKPKAINALNNNFGVLLDTYDTVSWVYLFDSATSKWRISLPVSGKGHDLLFHGDYIYVATSAGLYRFRY